jgi:5,10-methylenetetrahydromethanopterin reductase
VASVNPFTCHPINIAANIALIDEASGGRAYLGFCRGAWLDFAGIEPERPVAALREAMACVRHLLTRSTEPFQGDVFSIAGGDALRWQNIRPDIPFLLGTWGPQTVRACLPWAAEIKLGGCANPEAVPWLRQQIGDAGAGIVLGAVTVVAEDGEAARALARREVALYLPVVAELGPSLRIDPEVLQGVRVAAERFDFEAAGRYISDDLLRRICFAGTPHDVAEQALELFEAGASRVEFGTPHGLSGDEGVRLLGTRVLPILHRYRERGA